MTDSCCNVNKVFVTFNKMADGRSFTDYRPTHQIDASLYKAVKNVCDCNNNYESKICIQRNTDKLMKDKKRILNKFYNLPRCSNN